MLYKELYTASLNAGRIIAQKPTLCPLSHIPGLLSPFSAATLASIFLLAAKIISSLLFCNNACLSALFELQACPCFCFLPGVVSSSVLSDPSFIVASSTILAFRLYRVIRSGCKGFTCAGVDVAADDDAGTGRGGWKDCGGYTRQTISMTHPEIPTNRLISLNKGSRGWPSQESEASKTHHFQAPSTQYPLRSSHHISPISLQIPHDAPPRNLREHLLYPLYICFPRANVIR
jgi:hypothetical protein